MDFLIYIGGAITLVGLVGLGYCIKLAIAIKGENLSAEETTKRLQSLSAWNMAAMGVSSIGLMFVIISLVV